MVLIGTVIGLGLTAETSFAQTADAYSPATATASQISISEENLVSLHESLNDIETTLTALEKTFGNMPENEKILADAGLSVLNASLTILSDSLKNARVEKTARNFASQGSSPSELSVSPSPSSEINGNAATDEKTSEESGIAAASENANFGTASILSKINLKKIYPFAIALIAIIAISGIIFFKKKGNKETDTDRLVETLADIEPIKNKTA